MKGEKAVWARIPKELHDKLKGYIKIRNENSRFRYTQDIVMAEALEQYLENHDPVAEEEWRRA